MEGRNQRSDDDGSPNYDRSSDGEGSEGADEEERSYDYQDDGYNSDQSPHKRQKSEETLKQDRISAMQDSILLHILSLLPTKDAVKTGILSQRWLYLWTSVPNLDFTCSKSSAIRRFCTFVDQTLILHKRCNVKKFKLNFHESYDYSFDSRVNVWLRFATRANVEELCLNLHLREDIWSDGVYYELPQHICTNSSITKLSLLWCDLVLVPKEIISWKSLKSLSIGYSNLSEDLIQMILAGSPSLEFLELCAIADLYDLNIKSLSLRELVVRDHSGFCSAPEISAPNLRSLGIMGTMYGNMFRLKDVRFLDDCRLNFGQSLPSDMHGNGLREILDRIRHVKRLTMGDWCIRVMATLAKKVQFFPLSRLQCLILETNINECDIPGIAGLLQSSPNLETLVITFPHRSMLCYEDDVPKYHWTLQDWRSKCSLRCLKTVEIVGFAECHLGFEHVIQLVQFLLESARVLEKMVIKSQKIDPLECSPKGLLKVAQSLLTLPRSSPRAVVIFSE